MTAEDKLTRPKTKPIVLSPWLVVLAGLALYGLTLNHWVTLHSLPLLSQINGWDWHPLPLQWRPEAMRPLFFVVTWPVRLLPAAWQPLSLNALGRGLGGFGAGTAGAVGALAAARPHPGPAPARAGGICAALHCARPFCLLSLPS